MLLEVFILGSLKIWRSYNPT